MAKHMPKRNLERVGQGVTGACVALVTLLVLALIVMAVSYTHLDVYKRQLENDFVST